MAVASQGSCLSSAACTLVAVLAAGLAAAEASPGAIPRLGQLESAGAASLLQISAFTRRLRGGRSAALGTRPVLLQFERPQEAHSAVDKARELVQQAQAKLAEQEVVLQEELGRRKAQYTKFLQSQDDHIHHLEQKAKELARTNEELTAKANTSRAAAKTLQSDIAAAKQRLEGLQGNFTSAQEFLNVTSEKLRTEMESSRLDVLQELDQRDAKSVGQALINSIRKRRHPKFVQIAEQPTDTQAATLISSLHGGLQELTSSRQERIQELKDWFATEKKAREESMQRAQTSYDALLQEKNKLDTLNARMQVALNYLQAEKSQLSDRENALRRFAQRLGIRPTPVPLSRSIDDMGVEATM